MGSVPPESCPSRGWELNPFQRALLPYPDIADDQNREEDHHFNQAEQAESLEPYRPGKKKDRLHIEDHEEDRDDVVADGVPSACVVDGVNAALVGHELGLAGIVRPHEFGEQQGERQHSSDEGDEDEDGDVVLWHKMSGDHSPLGSAEQAIVALMGPRFKKEWTRGGRDVHQKLSGKTNMVRARSDFSVVSR